MILKVRSDEHSGWFTSHLPTWSIDKKHKTAETEGESSTRKSMSLFAVTNDYGSSSVPRHLDGPEILAPNEISKERLREFLSHVQRHREETPSSALPPISVSSPPPAWLAAHYPPPPCLASRLTKWTYNSFAVVFRAADFQCKDARVVYPQRLAGKLNLVGGDATMEQPISQVGILWKRGVLPMIGRWAEERMCQSCRQADAWEEELFAERRGLETLQHALECTTFTGSAPPTGPVTRESVEGLKH